MREILLFLEIIQEIDQSLNLNENTCQAKKKYTMFEDNNGCYKTKT